MEPEKKCRFCGTKLRHEFIDLGMQPLCESFLDKTHLNYMEPFYPLTVHVCSNCFLVQLEEYVNPQEIFTDYAYFSSYSTSWLKHAENYVNSMIENYDLENDKQIIELGSNDGYLLQYFVKKGYNVLGIEPAQNVAKVAIDKGIPTLTKFFGLEIAKELVSDGITADLLIGNNVLAQVPNLNDFVSGMKRILAPNGIITMEFPHLMKLIDENQFDTIYHEHFSYFSFTTVEKIFLHHGLKIFNVDELPTHGGSIRIYVSHIENPTFETRPEVREMKIREEKNGYNEIEFYSSFKNKVHDTKFKLLKFLIEEKNNGKSIVGYGAPGKGNTLLNYCGIKTEFLDYTVDINPHKQGKFLPGSHIPIYKPDKIYETRPDFVLILPWNIKEEIISQMSNISEWGGKFVVPIPEVEIYDPEQFKR